MPDAENGGKLILFYVSARSEQGLTLYHMLREKLPTNRFDWNVVNCPEEPDGTKNLEQRQFFGMCASLAADLVIFDGSLDDPEFSQYQYALPIMTTVDYSLIVSRTALPYNFEGVLKGGAPAWILPRAMTKDPSPLPEDGPWTNERIVAWIADTLEHGNLELPRKNKLSLDGSPLKGHKVFDALYRILDDAKKREKRSLKQDVFVSYRSDESRYKSLRKSQFPPVEDMLLETLKEETESNGRFLYFPPGQITLGIITRARMMELVNMIDREMRKCRTVLLYRTPDYDQSWWTTAELMALSYLLFGEDKANIRVICATPVQDESGSYSLECIRMETPEEIKRYVPHLSKEQHTRLVRRYISSDPLKSSYEMNDYMFIMAKLPGAAKSILAVIGGAIVTIATRFDPLRKAFEDEKRESLWTTIKRGRKSLNSLTYTEEYWKERLIECDKCRDDYLRNRADLFSVNEYLDFIKPYTKVISVAESEKMEAFFRKNRNNTEARYELILPCGHHARLRWKGCYYRFLQPRMGRKVNLKKPLVETLDIFGKDVPCW